MQELELTSSRVARIWWLLAWRSVVGSFAIGFALGFVFGVLAYFMGLPRETVTLVSGLLGALTGLAWSFVVVGMALRKKYSDFRIVLVPRETV